MERKMWNLINIYRIYINRMNFYRLFTFFILFVVVTPGVIITLPIRNKVQVAVIHGLLFSVCVYFDHLLFDYEGFGRTCKFNGRILPSCDMSDAQKQAYNVSENSKDRCGEITGKPSSSNKAEFEKSVKSGSDRLHRIKWNPDQQYCEPDNDLIKAIYGFVY